MNTAGKLRGKAQGRRTEKAQIAFEFGTKAETLSRIVSLLELSRVPPLHIFCVDQWRTSSDDVLDRVVEKFAGARLAVRSSALTEDGAGNSLAGEFLSSLNIDGASRPEIGCAIGRVIESYPGGIEDCASGHQIVVQEMVADVSMSGVVFTQDLNTGSPYYVINYDDVTGRTDTVTSGADQGSRTLYVHRGSTDMLRSTRFIAVLNAVREIERISRSSVLDIEFAVDSDENVYLLQVRKITTQPNWNRGIALRVNDKIDRMAEFGAQRFSPASGVFGAVSLFGQMPDWNPVEIIGSRPRPLATSLYQRLITDRAWRVARRQMGYLEPRGEPLMYMLGGQPYIDVRLSFNSYLPADLPAEIAEKLVNGWLGRLSRLPHLHDKVEFDVAITALAFDFNERFDAQCDGVLTKGERDIFRDALHRLTADLLTGRVAAIDGELEKTAHLEKQRCELLSGRAEPNMSTVAALLEDCVEFGTVPFSILARHGFIAQTFLKSLVSRQILSRQDRDRFLANIKTVASELVEHINDVARGEMSSDDFLERYGHLRPGTYDILSLRYDQRRDLFDGAAPAGHRSDSTSAADTDEVLSADQFRAIDALLKEHDYDMSSASFLDYIVRATKAREYAKFVFTRNLSDTLELIAHIGEQNGLSRDELSFIPIDAILSTHTTTKGRTTEEYLRSVADTERMEHQVTSAIQLSHLVREVSDFHVVPLLLSRPNFITSKSVHGSVVFLDGHDVDVHIADRIVVIESADPGFDWIFTRSIRGLVTKFGGANSHMAIRCAEFGIPAAIGCGEQIFQRALRAASIELNCAQGLLSFSE